MENSYKALLYAEVQGLITGSQTELTAFGNHFYWQELLTNYGGSEFD